MKVQLVLALAVTLTGCASFSGIQFAPGEPEACAQTQRCLVMTPEQMRRYYGMAFQAGRAYEEGRRKGEEEQKEDHTPWLDEDFYQRAL